MPHPYLMYKQVKTKRKKMVQKVIIKRVHDERRWRRRQPKRLLLGQFKIDGILKYSLPITGFLRQTNLLKNVKGCSDFIKAIQADR